MAKPYFQSIAEQVAAHLREEFIRGRWIGVIPGKNQLAEELEINCKTVVIALNQLESEGLLVGHLSGIVKDDIFSRIIGV